MADTDLLFRIKADSSEARADIRKLRETLESETKAGAAGFAGISQNLAGFSSGLHNFAGRAATYFTAIHQGFGAVQDVLGPVVALLRDTVTETVTLGSQFNDLSIKTGLSVETLSGLDLQLRQSGTSAETLGTSFLNLQRSLGLAAKGNEDLQETFRQLGIDDFEGALANADETLRVVVRSLAAIRDEGTRNVVGNQIFGKSYQQLAVFIRDTGGNIDAVIAKARELGLVMSKEAAASADELGDQMDEVGRQLAGVKRQIGQELMPVALKALEDFSKWLKENKDDVKAVAEGTKEAANELAEYIKYLNALKTGDFRGVFNYITTKQVEPKPPETPVNEDVYGPGGRMRGGTPSTKQGNEPYVVSEGEGGADFQLKDAQQAERAKRLMEQARAASRQADSIIAETAHRAAIEAAEALYKQDADFKAFTNSLIEAENALHKASLDGLREQRNAEKAAAVESDAERELQAEKVRTLDAKMRAEKQRHVERVRDLENEMHAKSFSDLQERHKRELEAYRANADEYIKRQKELAENGVITHKRADQLITAEMAAGLNKRREYLVSEIAAIKDNAEVRADLEHELTRLHQEADAFQRAARQTALAAMQEDFERLQEALERARQLADELQVPAANIPGGNQVGTPFDPYTSGPMVPPEVRESLGPPPELFSEWEMFGVSVRATLDGIAQSAGTTAESVGRMAGGIVGALGNAVKGWASYGDSIGKAAKNALAFMLDAVAQESIVQGMRQAALALAALASLDFRGAAIHGAAAAQWFALAAFVGKGGAALAGQGAVAGNAYGAAGGGGGSSTVETERDRTIREARAGGAPDPTVARDGEVGDLVLKIDAGDDRLEERIVRIYRRNGQLRGVWRADTLGEASA